MPRMKIIYAILAIALFTGCRQGSNTKKEEPGAAKASIVKIKAFTFRLPGGLIGRCKDGEYSIYADSVEKHHGHNVPTIRSLTQAHFATIMTSVKPDAYIGKRIRYTAAVRTKDVAASAGMWLRIDPAVNYSKTNLGYDNMSNRPIKGTTTWTHYEVVMDVPAGAGNIVYGLLLNGNGQAWIDSMDIKIVDKNVPLTGK